VDSKFRKAFVRAVCLAAGRVPGWTILTIVFPSTASPAAARRAASNAAFRS
jgi:hypothetical protein